jgi:hypothetical protein
MRTTSRTHVVGLAGVALLAGFAILLPERGGGAPAPEGTGPLFVDSGQALGNANSAGVALGDLDDDGDLDAFVAVFASAPHRVWINSGGAQGGTPGVFVDSGQLLGDDSGTDVALADVDGDGDLDAFVAHDGLAPDQVWLNDGDGTFTDSGQALGAVSSQAVALADLDGDGDPDALVAALGGARVWLNQGGAQGGTPGLFLEFGPLLGPFNALAVALGDLDGDGDRDAFLGCGGSTTGAPDRVFFNVGGGLFIDSKQFLGGTRTYDVALLDADGDGDLDAWAATGGQPTQDRGDRLWVNQGGAQGGTPGQFLGTGTTYGSDDTRGVASGDFDADGDLDLFAANQSGADRVWRNDGGLFADAGESLGFDISMDVGIGDVDGDGSLDAYVAAFGPDRVWLGTVVAAETRGLVRAPVVLDPGAVVSADDLALADLDGDGDLDVVYGPDESGDLRTLVNQGGLQGGTPGSFELGTPISDLPTPWIVRFELGDLDGDADADLFLLDDDLGGEAEDRVYVNQGGAQGGTAGTFADSGQRLSPLDGAEVLLVDVERDGDLDAVVRNGIRVLEQDEPTELWLNQGGAQGGTPGQFALAAQDLGSSTVPVFDGSLRRLASGDFDGDGDADLVLVVGFELAIYLNQGGAQGGVEGAFAATGQSLAYTEALLVGTEVRDFDGDGDVDLAAASTYGSLLVFLNGGSGSFTASPWCIASAESSGMALQAADFDLDGELDLAAGSFTSSGEPRLVEGTGAPSLALYFGDGTGRFAFGGQCLEEREPPGAGWNPERITLLRSGDVDGDGDPDLVGLRAVGTSAPKRPVLLGNGGPPGFERCCAAQYAVLEARRYWDPAGEECVDRPPSLGARGPAGNAADGLVDLGVYARLRSSWLTERSDGQWVIDFYAAHELEVAVLLATEPALLGEAIAALRLWEDDVALLVAGQGELETVSQEEIDAIEAFLASLQAEGSAQLAQAIADRLAQLPPLPSLVGQSLDDAAVALTGLWVPYFADGFESGDTGGWSAAVP